MKINDYTFTYTVLETEHKVEHTAVFNINMDEFYALFANDKSPESLESKKEFIRSKIKEAVKAKTKSYEFEIIDDEKIFEILTKVEEDYQNYLKNE